jgi:hypothetical protein
VELWDGVQNPGACELPGSSAKIRVMSKVEHSDPVGHNSDQREAGWLTK